MAYTTNPHLPRLRMEAVRMVESGKSVRAVARHFDYSHGAVLNWVRRAKGLRHNIHTIPTRSSRPLHHPQELSTGLVNAVLDYRVKYHRCAKVIHHLLQRDGYAVSLSSVERVLRRFNLVNHSKWKKWHTYPPRPVPERPGILIEIDTIIDGPYTDRLYAYTLLDVCARWAYAVPTLAINTHHSLDFIQRAKNIAPFPFSTIQSDHGSEFSKWFTKRVVERGLSHRHSRVRTPNDNAHLERFNRTLQEECLNRIPRNIKVWQKEIPEYLRYYNYERPHMGLEMKSPIEVVRSY